MAKVFGTHMSSSPCTFINRALFLATATRLTSIGVTGGPGIRWRHMPSTVLTTMSMSLYGFLSIYHPRSILTVNQAAYWAFYRVARNYPTLVKLHTWQWYINQAFLTVKRMTDGGVGYVNDGLMDETVFRFLLDDLKREGLTANATLLEARMQARQKVWAGERYPFVRSLTEVTSAVSDIWTTDLDLRWHGTRLAKKEFTHGADISIIPPRRTMSSTPSSHTSQRFLTGGIMGMQGVIGETSLVTILHPL